MTFLSQFLMFSKVVVAFDIDRTLRMGTSEGIKPRDPQIDEVLASLQALGVTMLALTGAQADCNPLVQDATQGGSGLYP